MMEPSCIWRPAQDLDEVAERVLGVHVEVRQHRAPERAHRPVGTLVVGNVEAHATGLLHEEADEVVGRHALLGRLERLHALAQVPLGPVDRLGVPAPLLEGDGGR
jgi:hypothetical protein